MYRQSSLMRAARFGSFLVMFLGFVVVSSSPVLEAHAQSGTPSFSELVRTGLKAFEERKYEEASVAFRSAYRLRPNPTLLYNVGQCFERMARVDDAIAYYEAYLEAPGTTSEDRADAIGRIRTLREELRARDRLQTLPKVEERPPASAALPKLPPRRASESKASPRVEETPSDLVLIVHANNKLEYLTRSQVRRIYLGKMNAWPDGTRIRTYSRPARSGAGKVFFSSKTGLGVREYRQHWQRMQLTGAALAPTQRNNTPTMIREIAASPGAIGYALRSELPAKRDGVRVITVR